MLGITELAELQFALAIKKEADKYVANFKSNILKSSGKKITADEEKLIYKECVGVAFDEVVNTAHLIRTLTE